jgi:hypothetical protein
VIQSSLDWRRQKLAMIGWQATDQARFSYEFQYSIQPSVATDQCIRRDRARRQRHKLADHYSHTGRPSIDPDLLLRMLLAGYCNGIRPERRLCKEVEELGQRQKTLLIKPAAIAMSRVYSQ